MIPAMIVMMGNFSAAAASNAADADYLGLREGFTQLARLIDTYTTIKVRHTCHAPAQLPICPAVLSVMAVCTYNSSSYANICACALDVPVCEVPLAALDSIAFKTSSNRVLLLPHSIVDLLHDCHVLLCPVQANTQFMFVPGPNDPGLGQVLPQPALPTYFTGELQAVLPNAVFATNPCR
jgi:hypothetical protein